jgi:DNA-binding NtrC family response regulator
MPLLVRHVIDRRQGELGRRIEIIQAETMDRLAGYSWPGNVRELQNVIDIKKPRPGLSGSR